MSPSSPQPVGEAQLLWWPWAQVSVQDTPHRMLRRWPCLPAASSPGSCSPRPGESGRWGPLRAPPPGLTACPRTRPCLISPVTWRVLVGCAAQIHRDPSVSGVWVVEPPLTASASPSLCPVGRPVSPLDGLGLGGSPGRAVAPSLYKNKFTRRCRPGCHSLPAGPLSSRKGPLGAQFRAWRASGCLPQDHELVP